MIKSYLILLSVVFFMCSLIEIPQTYAQSQVQVSQDKTLQYAKPKKPLRIKLHRSKNGEYSWDITGENVDEIVRADKRLRKLLLEDK